MAVAFDAASSNFWVAPNNGSLSHVPVGTPKGVLVGIAQSLVTSDDGDIVAGVTYGGVAMTRLEHVVDAAGEIGHAYLYFLGSSIPTGSQTVAIDTNGTNDAMWACCITMTATGDTAVADSGSTSGDAANPSITLTTLSGFAGHVFATLFSGQNAPSSITAGSGYTKRGTDRDFGSQSAAAESGDKSGANVVANFTVAIEDVAMVAAAVQEASLDATLTASALVRTRAFGAHTVLREVTLSPSSLVRTRIFGSHSVTLGSTVVAGALVRTRAFGAATVLREVTLTATSLVRTRAFGTATLSQSTFVTPTSVVHTRAFGTATIDDGLGGGPPPLVQLSYGKFSQFSTFVEPTVRLS